MLAFLSASFPVVLLAGSLALERFERQLQQRDIAEP
jgi:hypothetical protein